MVKAAKKKQDNAVAAAKSNPEADERKRLKKLAFATRMLSDTPPSRSTYSQLLPSKTLLKHHGKDILKKSQRKNRFLFSFPGLLAPITGGKIGDLKDLGTKNPILYLLFPQGQMKLFGTIVYPKNRYLTLHFSRGGKNVTCEDYFDTMIVFSDAWWIGEKDENPDETKLKFPEELISPVEYDFKGGAGGESEFKQGGVPKAGLTFVKAQSSKTDCEDDLSNDENNSLDWMKATPARHSRRTAGKRFNFADVPSGSGSSDGYLDNSEDERKKLAELGKSEKFCSIVLDNAKSHNSNAIPDSIISLSKAKKASQCASQPEDLWGSKSGSFVQATLSKFFKKADGKDATCESQVEKPNDFVNFLSG